MDEHKPDYYSLCWRDPPTGLSDLVEMLASYDLSLSRGSEGILVVEYDVPGIPSSSQEKVSRVFSRIQVEEAARLHGVEPEAASVRLVWDRFLQDIKPRRGTPVPF